MPLYLLSVCYPAGATQPEPAALERIMARRRRRARRLVAAGAWVFGGGLHDPSSATACVDDRDGDAVLTDGPFIESKEQIGGITDHRRSPTSTRRSAWARGYSRAIDRADRGPPVRARRHGLSVGAGRTVEMSRTASRRSYEW